MGICEGVSNMGSRNGKKGKRAVKYFERVSGLQFHIVFLHISTSHMLALQFHSKLFLDTLEKESERNPSYNYPFTYSLALLVNSSQCRIERRIISLCANAPPPGARVEIG